MKECPNCFAMMEDELTVCPNCSFDLTNTKDIKNLV